MTDGEDCKSSMTRMLDGADPEEHVPQPPHISAPIGREGFMHHRIQMTSFHPGSFEQQSANDTGNVVHSLPSIDNQSVPGSGATLIGPASPVHVPLKDHARPSLLDMTEDERVRRRREINRNSQRRIRERRMKELEELRTETNRLRQDNDQMLRQVECVTAEKAELLRQIQEITEKWQHSIAENAVLNRENLQLRTSLQQITGLSSVVTGSIAGGVPAQELPEMETVVEKRDQHNASVVSPSLPWQDNRKEEHAL